MTEREPIGASLTQEAVQERAQRITEAAHTLVALIELKKMQERFGDGLRVISPDVEKIIGEWILDHPDEIDGALQTKFEIDEQGSYLHTIHGETWSEVSEHSLIAYESCVQDFERRFHLSEQQA